MKSFLPQNFSRSSIISAGLIPILILVNSCSRNTVSFVNQIYPHQEPNYHNPNENNFTAVLIDAQTKVELKQENLIAASNESIFIPDYSRSLIKSQRKNSKTEVKQIRTHHKKFNKEPVSIKNRNTFAIMGFVFSIVSVIFLFVFPPLLIGTLPLATLFSILGLKGEKKPLSWIGLGIVIGLATLILVYVGLMMYWLSDY